MGNIFEKTLFLVEKKNLKQKEKEEVISGNKNTKFHGENFFKKTAK